MVDTTRSNAGRDERVGLVLLPGTDFVVLEAQGGTAICRQPGQALSVDVAFNLGVAPGQVQRASFAQRESRRSLARSYFRSRRCRAS